MVRGRTAVRPSDMNVAVRRESLEVNNPIYAGALSDALTAWVTHDAIHHPVSASH